MALTPEQIAKAVIKDSKRKQLANFEIRQRRSELVGRWLRSTPWFLRLYSDMEQQSALYRKIEPHIFRLTQPKKKKVSKMSDLKPHEDPRNLQLFK